MTSCAQAGLEPSDSESESGPQPPSRMRLQGIKFFAFDKKEPSESESLHYHDSLSSPGSESAWATVTQADHWRDIPYQNPDENVVLSAK